MEWDVGKTKQIPALNSTVCELGSSPRCAADFQHPVEFLASSVHVKEVLDLPMCLWKVMLAPAVGKCRLESSCASV